METWLPLGACAGPNRSALAGFTRNSCSHTRCAACPGVEPLPLKMALIFRVCACVQSEHLQKLLLEDLREFLQERLAVSFFLPDDVVIEQLQAAMAELRSKKLDQPPPGARVFPFFFFFC